MVRLALVLLALVAASVARAESVVLSAADGVKVYGEVWRAAAAKVPIVVAFHQAGSSAAEYAPIAPRLVQAGFTVLAIDQRSGDGAFGGTNRTAAALGWREASYDSALPDLEAALGWAKVEAHGAPVVVWGSSYSAALVFLLAAAHPGDVAAIVAVSPGEYLARKDAVRAAARKVTVPVYIDQASDKEEVASAAAILKAVKSSDKQQFVAAGPSTHGSSTLRDDKNAAGAEAHWKGVLAFLARIKATN
jgi:dienelactone hydrolase